MYSRREIRALRSSVSASALVAALAGSALLLPSAANAGGLPANGRYVAGSGGFQYSGNGLTIDQNSTRGIIDWQSFSIGQGQTVQFDNGSGATLNEVTGGNLSQIAGSLKATGSVYLVNPSGVIVTPTGQVITQGSFVASTRSVDNGAFMTGSGLQFSGSSSGNVLNQGTITSANGDVVLFGNNARAAQYSNTSANNGTVAILAGDSILYQPGDNSEILVKGGKGNATNHGTIKAAQAELAAAGGNVYAMAGTNAGVIRATGTATIDGHVWLTAGNQTQIAGSISAQNADGSGGTIIATGNSVNVANKATISADGTNGGTVLIGGDEHGGSDPSQDLVSQYVPDAQTTNIASGALISANGTAGAGGNIVLWSQKQTRFKGKVEARGSKGASGGNAEVSSHSVLAFKGHVDLTSFGGPTGNLLLDPSNVVISNGSTTGEQIALIQGGEKFVPTAADSVIGVNTLESALATANVTVATQSSYSSLGDITLDNFLTWSTHTLTLDAYHSIYFTNTVAVTGTGSLTLKTNDGGSGGDYYFDGGNITFASTTGNETLTINGTQYTLVPSVSSLASAISNNSSGDYALANSYNAGPDGTYTSVPVSQTFSGVFAGLGNTISNLSISDNSDSNVGLFAEVQGTVRDLTLSSPSVTADSAYYLGILVGQMERGLLLDDTVTAGTAGTVRDAALLAIGGLVGEVIAGTVKESNLDSSSQVNFSGSAGTIYEAVAVGGLVGLAQSSAQIENTSSGATVRVAGGTNVWVGGLLGSSFATVDETFATGSVIAATATGFFMDAGGLIGAQEGGSVSGSYATGLLKATEGNLTGYGPFTGSVGGLIGYLSGSGSTVAGSYATSVIVASSDPNYPGGNVGGLVGWADANTSISGSYASGSVTGYGANVGGFVGLNDGAISTSYAGQSGTGPNSGPLIASGASLANVGGLVGFNNTDGSISQSFSAPNETATMQPAISGADSSSVGGLVGENLGTIANSYSYPTASGTQAPIVGGNSSDVGGLVGYTDNLSHMASQITSSYSTGLVSGGSSSSLGGSLGYDNNSNGTTNQYRYVYWDTTTSGQTCAAGNACSDSGITGQTTSQLISGLPTGLSPPYWKEISNVIGGLPCLVGVTSGCSEN